MSVSEAIEQAILAIIRPPRSVYNIDQMPSTVPIKDYGEIIRHHCEFKNFRDQKIIGSYYQPNEQIDNHTCVIYLHGNASCQIDGTYLVPVFVPAGIGVFCLDTSGSGLSDGEYVSLGFLEKDDVMAACEYLRENFKISKFALYGHSMGAANIFFCLANDQEKEDSQNNTFIAAVSDSPFSSLELEMRELAGLFSIPGCFVTPAVWYVARRIRNMANFDIHDVEPVKYAPICKQPILIIHGKEDDYINYHHSEILANSYGGPKELILCKGDHNSVRPMNVQIKSIQFLANYLGVQIPESDIQQRLFSAHEFFPPVNLKEYEPEN